MFDVSECVLDIQPPEEDKMNMIKFFSRSFIKKWFSRLTTHDACNKYAVRDITTGRTIKIWVNAEDAYRMAIGVVRNEVVRQDNGEHWRSLADFDRETISLGFSAMYHKLRLSHSAVLPDVIVVQHKKN